MKALDYPPSLLELIAALKRMPGVGSRGAERLALWFLQSARNEAHALASALDSAVDSVSTCPVCGFFASQGERCAACADPERDSSLFCVVEQPTDVLPLERCGLFRGLYHCLGGKISPLDGVMPEDLSVARLLSRVEANPGCEVILALSSDVEGEATALFLAEELAHLPCRCSRLAQGLPSGTALSHTDALTLSQAFLGRRALR